MNKHQIEEREAIITELQNDASAMVREFVKAGFGVENENIRVRHFPEHLGWLANVVSQLNDCRALLYEDAISKTSRLAFAGYTLDVKVATWMFGYLLDCVKRSHRVYERAIKTNDLKTLEKEFNLGLFDVIRVKERSPRMRGDAFRVGMCSALVFRIRDVITERDRARRGAASSNALVVIKQTKIDEVFDIKPNEQEVNNKPKVNPLVHAGYIAGGAAASRVNLNPTAVENNSKDNAKELQ